MPRTLRDWRRMALNSCGNASTKIVHLCDTVVYDRLNGCIIYIIYQHLPKGAV